MARAVVRVVVMAVKVGMAEILEMVEMVEMLVKGKAAGARRDWQD